MHSPRILPGNSRLLSKVALLCLCWPLAQAWASPARQHEIRVTLFGQLCSLSGPFDEATLKAVHSVSPEQSPAFYQAEDLAQFTPAQLQQAVTRLKKPTQALPALFDRYRERQTKRLSEMLGLLEGLEALKKEGKTTRLASAAKPLLKGKAAENYANAVKELESASKKKVPRDAAQAKVFEIYHDAVEPDPQEEFHRAVQRLNIRYNCVYEDEDNGGAQD